MAVVNLETMTPFELEKLRTPVAWDDFSGETFWQRRQKRALARKFGVAAILHHPKQVRDRLKQLALYEASTMPEGNVTAVLLKGGGPAAGQFFPEVRRKRPDCNFIVDYIEGSRFELGQTGEKDIKFKKDMGKIAYKMATRYVTLFDEVGDVGITSARSMKIIEEKWQEFHPGEVLGFRLILLSDKGLASYDMIEPRNLLIGFRDPVIWLSGMGMDGEDEEHDIYEINRWDDFIAVSPVQHEKYREALPEVLDTLGDRAVMKFEDFVWTDK